MEGKEKTQVFKSSKLRDFLYKPHVNQYRNCIASLATLERFNGNQEQKYKNSFFKYLIPKIATKKRKEIKRLNLYFYEKKK